MLKFLFSCFSLSNNNNEIKKERTIIKEHTIIKHRLTSKQIRRLKRKSLYIKNNS